MIKTIRVMMLPNNKQQTKLFQYANAARYTYNWALRKERENHKKGQGYLSADELEERFMQLKEVEAYRWLSEIPEAIKTQAIKEAGNAYKNFLAGVTNCPKFKQKERSLPGFYQEKTKVQFTHAHIIVESLSSSNRKNRQRINKIRVAQHGQIPVDGSHGNIRFSFDGNHWYATVEVMVSEKESSQKDKNCIHKENGREREMKQERKGPTYYLGKDTYKNVETLEKVKKLEKRKRRLQRSIARKYEKNKKGDTCYKTRNMIKKEKELQKLSSRLANILCPTRVVC
ncbi:MAG: helix-turn-helix domain-containing protein [Lachnospiraceae bacterium]|nr:helix-turn-helix domain-containing protein [Lachnospiraceae bacterium]